MRKTQLAKAIALTVGGIALAGVANTASAGTTMYNTFNYGVAGTPETNKLMANIPAFGGVVSSGANGTDGWTHTVGKDLFGNVQSISHGDGPGVQNATSGISEVPWVGSAAAPFGYTGGRALHWGADLSGAGDSANISSADSNKYAFNGGSFYADIDTAKGAWRDGTPGTASLGWQHDLDIGLIKSDISQQVTLSVGSIGNAAAEYGITVYKGMDTTALSDFNHHAQWHSEDPVTGNAAPDNTTGPIGPSPANPHLAAASGLNEAAIAENIDAAGWSVNELVFTAEAGEVYTVMLGGYKLGNWNDSRENYSLDITTSAVPVPAAVWLFGSALAGMGAVGRRKREEKA